MSYILKQQLAAKGNYGGARPAYAIQYLVYHYTANDGDSDEGNGSYFAQHIVQASAHYFVDDDSVTLSVPELFAAYSVGGAKWTDCPQTGGGSRYGQCSNYNSLSIEMCDTVRNGVYDFSPSTLRNAAELGGKLCCKYGISPDHVICHFDVNGKHCPGVTGWIGRDRSAWAKFKREVLIMTGKEIFLALDAYLGSCECPDWAKKELDEAVAMGITDGKAASKFAPRYQTAIMVKRAAVAAKK